MLSRTSLAPERPRQYRRYALVGRHFVDGWLTPLGLVFIDALEHAQRQQGVEGHVAEIGIHHGKLFLLLSLLRRQGERAVAVDLFEDQDLNVDRSGHGDRVAFLANLDRWHPGAPDVVVEQADSNTVDGPRLRELAGGPLRIVSVDGGHTADLTRHDLTTAVDALAPGGLVILDDCFNELFPAVAEGTQRFLQERPDVAAVGAAGNKTFLAQATHAGHYRDVMARRADELGLYHQEHSSFLGQPFHSVFPPEQRAAVNMVHRADYWWRWSAGWLAHHWARATK